MDELIKIHHREGMDTVSGKELHEFLEIKKDYSSWVKVQIERGMFEKSNDYCIVPRKVATGIAERFVRERFDGYEDWG